MSRVVAIVHAKHIYFLVFPSVLRYDTDERWYLPESYYKILEPYLDVLSLSPA